MAVKTINLKKKKWLGKKELIVIISAIVLTTAGIKAADQWSLPDVKEPANVKIASRCPDDMVFITSSQGGFCIDKYEASASAECPVANPFSQEDTKSNIDSSDCKSSSVAGSQPWRFVSQNQAAAACAKTGKRLPTNKEWQQAALGTPDPAANWTPDDCQVASNWNNQPGLTGAGKKCVSSAGAYDMIGNVWEWVDGTVSDGKYEGRSLPENGFTKGLADDALPSEVDMSQGDPNYNNDYFWIKNKGVRAIARGGYWDNKSDAGQYSFYLVSPPSFTGSGVGFRCAK